jgi:hypothetical protein
VDTPYTPKHNHVAHKVEALAKLKPLEQQKPARASSRKTNFSRSSIPCDDIPPRA